MKVSKPSVELKINSKWKHHLKLKHVTESWVQCTCTALPFWFFECFWRFNRTINSLISFQINYYFCKHETFNSVYTEESRHFHQSFISVPVSTIGPKVFLSNVWVCTSRQSLTSIIFELRLFFSEQGFFFLLITSFT